jgi:hypothetical protein
MPIVLRTRPRAPRLVKVSKRSAGTRKPDIPSELDAPITGKIERQLRQLVAQFGAQEVLEVVDALVTKCQWNDWQCVANAIRRIARKT